MGGSGSKHIMSFSDSWTHTSDSDGSDGSVVSVGASKKREREAPRCARCYRLGHVEDDCWAWKTASGSPLPRRQAKHNVPAPPVEHKGAAGVYVLKGGDMYYVGKSVDVEARVAQHRAGKGGVVPQHMGEWTRVPPATAGAADDLEAWERKETLHLMRCYGVERVRGWMFTSVALSEEQRAAAFAQVCERYDLCRRCGRDSHFAAQCYARTRAGWAEGAGPVGAA